MIYKRNTINDNNKQNKELLNKKKAPFHKNDAFNVIIKDSIITDNEGDRKIAWSKSLKLTWSYFQGKIVPDSLSYFHAVTWTQSAWDNFKVYKDSIVTDIVCYFIIDKSWKSDENISEDLLNHEKRHFDLAEIITRKLRKELLEYISIDAYDSKLYFEYLSTVKYRELRKRIANQYDQETNHGMNKKAQKRWDTKIDNLLKESERYSNPHVIILKKWK